MNDILISFNSKNKVQIIELYNKTSPFKNYQVFLD